MSDAIIECKDVFKGYHDGKSELSVLKGINFVLQAREQVAILGRSGSGKTTLLQILGGLDLPDRGEVYFCGKNLLAISDEERGYLRNNALGFIYQLHHLLPEFSAVENVAMPLLISHKIDAATAIKAAINILTEVGLEHRMDHLPSQLSGGERQRVAIARALVNKPKCVLADEPTGNLDIDNAKQIMQLIKNLSKKHDTAFIIVTHDIDLANSLDKTYWMQDGVLRAQ